MIMSHPRMEYKKGDLLKNLNGLDAIAHGVNCQGVMGAGIALQIKHLFPSSFTMYKSLCDMWGNGYTLLGMAQVNTTIAPEVWNLFTQFSVGSGVQVSYTAINDAFESMFQQYSSEHREIRIGIPKIGAGLGGGNWSIIERNIEALLDKYRNIHLTVYEL